MKKKKCNIFKIVLSILFFIYLVIFISDVKNGEYIDINNYLVKEDYSYKNKLSMFTIRVSDKISNIVSSGVKSSFKFISKFIE